MAGGRAAAWLNKTSRAARGRSSGTAVFDEDLGCAELRASKIESSLPHHDAIAISRETGLQRSGWRDRDRIDGEQASERG